MTSTSAAQDELIRRAVLRLNAVTTGISVGLLAGGGLLLATVWLVVRDGADAGPHLGLLGQYLPGYTVTYTGGVLGLLYGCVIGYCCGFLVARIYNMLAR